jgi:M6 family metalloprotease-like protein/uncharacterized repeat protein (TIGR02543 family)
MQPDSSTVTIVNHGDERFNWKSTDDGYTLMQGSGGYLEYAEQDTSGDLRPSGVRAVRRGRRTRSVDNFLNRTPKNLSFSRRQRDSMRSSIPNEHRTLHIPRNTRQRTPRGMSQVTGPVAPTVVRFPVILVEFPNKPFTKTLSEFNALMNTSGNTANGITGSVHDYFWDQSYGQVDIAVDVFGPYMLPYDDTYYNYNYPNTLHPTGVIQKMPNDALEMAIADLSNTIDFRNYDIDSDGFVDGVHIIFAGHGAESGGSAASNIWSHKYKMDTYYSSLLLITNNGIKANVYSCSPELRGMTGSDITYIGVIAHELGHVFGLPDFYDTYEESGGVDAVTTNNWDIMSTGSWNDDGRTPAGHNPWSKNKMGWVPAVTLTKAMTTVTLPSPAAQGACYKMLTPAQGEYYLIENRQKPASRHGTAWNRWDSAVYGSGMLVYHVREENGDLNDAGNSLYNNRHFYIKQAGCTALNGCAHSITYDRSLDPFPTGGKTSFSDTTTPNAKTWGGVNTEQPITNITQNGDGSVSFNYTGIEPHKLASLSVSTSAGTAALSPAFHADSLHYRCIVSNNAQIATINATLHSTNWSVFSPTGLGPKNLSVGSNVFVVSAGSAFDTVNYTIEIYRLNRVNTLSSLALSRRSTAFAINPAFTSNNGIYSLNVPSTLDSITITAIPTDPHASISGDAGTLNLTRGVVNPFTIVVIPEDDSDPGWRKTYTISVSPILAGVKFVADGSVFLVQSAVLGQRLSRPQDPAVRAGYTFDGWYTDNTFAAPWDFTTNAALDTTILYARWMADRIVRFAGDDVSMPQINVPYGELIPQQQNPVRAGYAFGGWYRDNLFTTPQWDFAADYPTQDTTTLYARWLVGGTVTFAGDDVSMPQVVVAFGELIPRPQDPVRVGYSFGGWYRNRTLTAAWNFAVGVITSDTTLYAKWIKLVVVQYLNDVNLPLDYVTRGQPIVRPTPDPVRTGYIFDAWYKNSALTTPWSFASDAANSDTISLYARWIPVGIVVFKGENITIEPIVVLYGAKITKPADPVQIGCTFEGWYADENLKVTWNFATMSVSKDTIYIYAKWSGCSSAKTAVDAEESSSLLVYPTIVDDQMTIITSNTDGIYPIEVYTLSGALAAEFDANEEQTIVNIRNLAAGVYIVKHGAKNAKIVKR